MAPIVLHQGAMDIGQGANTVITQIFATALGVPATNITLIDADTDVTPDAGKTSASRQTYVSGGGGVVVCEALRARILLRMNVADDALLSFQAGQITAQDSGGTYRLGLADLTPDAEGYVLRAEETYGPATRSARSRRPRRAIRAVRLCRASRCG